MGAIAQAVGKSVELARLESENSGTGAASNLLGDFETELRRARQARESTEGA
jgi:hypothetical protein